MTEPECPSRAAERYLAAQEAAEGPEDGSPPPPPLECPKHKEKYRPEDYCIACFLDDEAETEKLIAEARARGDF